MTVNEYRKKHKRCRTCKHYRKAIFIYGFCEAKQQEVEEDTLIHRLRGCFCRIYEPEEQTMAELKPCPFCGHKAAIQKYENPKDGRFRYFATCLVCGVETPRIARTVKEAECAWNRRADHG